MNIRLTLKGGYLELSISLVYLSKLHEVLIDKAEKKSEEQGL